MFPCTVFFFEPNNTKQSLQRHPMSFVSVPRIGEKVLIGGVLWYCYDVIHNMRFNVVEIFLEHTK